MRERRSGTLKLLAKAEIMNKKRLVGDKGKRAASSANLLVGRRLARLKFQGGSGSNGTAGLLDLLAGGSADAFDLNSQFACQITRA